MALHNETLYSHMKLQELKQHRNMFMEELDDCCEPRRHKWLEDHIRMLEDLIRVAD